MYLLPYLICYALQSLSANAKPVYRFGYSNVVERKIVVILSCSALALYTPGKLKVMFCYCQNFGLANNASFSYIVRKANHILNIIDIYNGVE